MAETTNKSFAFNQQTIAEQLTVLDVAMRRQLAKNSSQTYVRSSFEPQDQQSQNISRKGSVKTSWFECGNSLINQSFRESNFSYASAFQERDNYYQKRARKIFSVANVNKQDSLGKKSEKKVKINVSLNKKTENKKQKVLNDVWSFQIEIQSTYKEAKQNKKLLGQEKIRNPVKESSNQLNLAKKFKQIKQPVFHSKHPLQVKKCGLNGINLSQMIAERALKIKSKTVVN